MLDIISCLFKKGFHKIMKYSTSEQTYIHFRHRGQTQPTSPSNNPDNEDRTYTYVEETEMNFDSNETSQFDRHLITSVYNAQNILLCLNILHFHC